MDAVWNMHRFAIPSQEVSLVLKEDLGKQSKAKVATQSRSHITSIASIRIVLVPKLDKRVDVLDMINLGRPHVKILSDGWTAVTRDRSLSAQFEHTIGVTEDGFEVFTYSPAGYHKPPYV